MRIVDIQVTMHQKYVDNETRIIEKFLLFPIKIDGITKWLETAKIKQKVYQIDVGGSGEWGVYKYRWKNHAWIEDHPNVQKIKMLD